MITEKDKNSFNLLTNFELIEAFNVANKSNSLELVTYLAENTTLGSHDLFKELTSESYFNLMLYGHLKIIAYIVFDSPWKHAFSYESYVDIFLSACNYGHLDLVQFLLSSELTKPYLNIKNSLEKYLLEALLNGHTDVVRYVLSSDEIRNNVVLNLEYAEIFNRITYPSGLKKAHHYDLLHFLIYEYQIERTDYINSIIERKPFLTEFFSKREFNEQLNESLPLPELIIVHKKVKI